MKVHILLNALDYGDAVSSHCVVLKHRCREVGAEAAIYAEHVHDRVRKHVSPLESLLGESTENDILIHQFFNETFLSPFVEKFPGRRVLMYHNITPPSFFPEKSHVFRSCARGLRQLPTLMYMYDHAVGMSDFSRRDLEQRGYRECGVFPFLIDTQELRRCLANPIILARPKPAQTVFLFVGRIAPNKKIEDLFRFLAVYRHRNPDSCLVLVGDDAQHPEYKRHLLSVMRELSLRANVDVRFTGKVPDDYLVAYYRTADASISLSEHEGFGAPLIESMVFDLPTFAYAAGACEETLAGAGVIFREKDFPAMAATVAEILSVPERREQILDGQRRRLNDFGAENQREQVRLLLERVCAKPRRSKYRPRVSVVINTYNRADRLHRCLSTLRDQTYDDFEVVVVNGPSTDGTAAMLDQHRNEIRVCQTDSRVLSVSRNVGIANAAGELVAFTDDDAVPDPRWLEELVGAFENREVGAAGGLVYRMNGRSIEFRNGILDRFGFVQWDMPEPGSHWNWEEGFINTVSGNNCIFRRSALLEIGGFDERIEYYHDEADVVMRLQITGWRTVHRPAAIVYHEAAKSHNRFGDLDLNWYVIAKNTVYCALKNYHGKLSKWRMGWRIARRVATQRMKPIHEWWQQRRICTSDFLRMELACLRGLWAGWWNGCRLPTICGEFGAKTPTKSFLRYPTHEGSGLSVCLLTQGLPQESPGGIATYTVGLARALREKGIEVHLITRGAYSSSEYREGIWYHTATPLPLDGGVMDSLEYPTAIKNLEYSNGIKAKVLDIEARWGVDLVESPNWDAEGLLTAMENRFPIVVRAHSPLQKVIETQGWKRTEDLSFCSDLEGLLLRHADFVSFSTEAQRDLIMSHFPVDTARTRIIRLGIDSPQPENNYLAAGAERIVLFVGRLERRKGIHTLLAAIPDVLAEIGDVRFVIAGRDDDSTQGSYWRSLWQAEHGDVPRGKVHFLGEVSEEDLHRLYSECDLFVAPSMYESCGLIYLEAMAHGKPIIGCRAGGIPEVVLDGETGLLVPPDDPESLCKAIVKLLSDEELRRRFAHAGRERYQSFFTAEVMGARTMEFYLDVVRARNCESDVVWQADALEMKRSPTSTIRWMPETSRNYVMAEKGSADTVIYGPYAPLKAGSYRAEFKLWIGDVPKPSTCLARVDVFSLDAGVFGEYQIWSEDFTAGLGSVFDVYFAVPDLPPSDFEFRVHTTGEVPLYVREIIVRRWSPNRKVASTAPLHARTTANLSGSAGLSS